MKRDIILLHGAIGASSQLLPLKKLLEEKYTVHLLDFPGHGGTSNDNEFSIESFSAFVENYARTKNLSRLLIFGYSMGGYVALHLAWQKPELVDAVATLATKFEWSPEIAAKESAQLNPAKIEFKLPQFAEQLAERHKPHSWKEVLTKTASMLLSLGKHPLLRENELSTIKQPALLMLGDRDKMVSLDETVTAYKKIPNARLAILPGTPHPFEMIDGEVLSIHLNKFFG